ncbi:methionine aminopeptidase [Lichtheimia hyalospora FSU 10163]|nr:methionine aminopeptidase [Lichtheimia hyalospora FSU 10163]
MLTWRSITRGIQKSAFHTSKAVRLPPRRSNVNSITSRWGSFERITPASLASVDVRTFPRRPVPDNIPHPSYAAQGLASSWESEIPCLSTQEQIQGLTNACQLAKKVLTMGGKMCLPGITTDMIDKELHQAIVDHGAYPSPLNYMGYPKSVCTSVNNIIAHSIPDDRSLQDGDIINIDVTVYLNGYHGDTSATFMVGNVDSKGRKLVEYTRECLDKAINICGPGVPFNEIGKVISDHAENNGYTVSEELTGHGIGTEFHCHPLIYHHRNAEEGTMEPGMAFTIEPILCQGSPMGILWPDQWTISTIDGGRSAQFEHTVLITNDGVNVLTK